MTVEVFWISGSPFTWRVFLALELKGVPYEGRLLEFSKNEQRSPDYLAINPRGRVPTLRHGDYVLSESLAILTYLDRAFPEPPHFGRSAEETGLIWRAISEFESDLGPAIKRIIGPIFRGADAIADDDIRTAVVDVHAELSRVEAAVAGRDWLVGDAVSGADIMLYPFIEALLRVAASDRARALDLGLLPLADRYPRLEGWRQHMTGLPGYERTYPPHWREAA